MRSEDHPQGAARPDSKLVELFSEAEISLRVDGLAKEIIANRDGGFVIVCLLKGSFVFVADLIRALYRHRATPRVEFLRLSSYGMGKVSSGAVQLLGDTPLDIAGREVLLIDDIVDTGRSIAYARALLAERGAADVRTCALLDKPSRRVVDVTVDWVGFTIPDVFVVGYGIDYAEDFRYLPYIGAIEQARAHDT